MPVKLVVDITAARQYYISDTIFTPDAVAVYAPSAILDTIKYAYTHYVELTNISDTVSRQVELVKIKEAKFVPNIIECTLSPDIYTEKVVEVPIIGVNFPSDEMLRTFPSKVQVIFRVGVSKFKTITSDDFTIVVSFEIARACCRVSG